MKFPSARIARILALGLGVAVASSLLVSVTAPAPAEAATAAAAKAKFTPGKIITDPLFYDFGSMTAAQIQKFLNKRVKKCSSKSQAPCLRNYRTATKRIDAIPGRCNNTIYAKKKQTAAQIIATVARACEVNPEVLLVTLQKEQGLVTAKSVKDLTYRKAMGYGCPDSSDCNKKYYGFFNQVYWAARAYNAYFNFPGNFRFQPGETLEINYSPKKGCGTTSVYLDNRATAALYNYTPYTPNSASLANPYKTGNSCSSYGNRNFWLYYNKWFGNSSLGEYFAKAGSSTYVVANGSRWKLPASSPRLTSTLAPLGSTATVSSAYISSLADGGALSPIVQVVGDPTTYYLLSGKTKYTLGGCAEVQAIGFSCAVPKYYPKTLAGYTAKNDLLGKNVVQVRTADGAIYHLADGVRRQVLNSASATAAGITLGTRVDLDRSVIEAVPTGAPIAKPDSLIINSSTGAGFYLNAEGTKTFTIAKSLLNEAPMATWFGGVDGKLDSSGTSRLPSQSPIPGIFSAPGASFAITKAGKTTLLDPPEWSNSIRALDPAIAAKIPTTSGSLSAPVIVQTAGTSTPTLIEGARRRALQAKGDVAAIAKATGVSATLKTISTAALEAVPAGKTILPPGKVVRTTASKATFLVNGLGARIAITKEQAKEITGSSSARTVSVASIAGYPVTSGKVPPGVTCGTGKYLAISGTLREVTPKVAAEYGSKFGFRGLDKATCATLKLSGTSGTLIKVGSKYYSVDNGHKSKLTSKQYAKLAKTGIPAKTVSKYFAALLPTKK